MTPTLLALRSFWLETPASTSAQNHDLVFYTLLYVMTFFFVLVIGIMLAFVVLYRRRKGQVQAIDGPTHNTPLEVSWTLIPLVVVLAFFVIGLYYYVDLEAPPADADVVDVEASQWHFNFKYPNGAESDDLYLRLNRPTLLRLVSKDVTHALYIPAFRMQRNAVPGRITQLWFKPTELTGTSEDSSFRVFCTQYCGNGHAEMHANCYVLNWGSEKEDYEVKLAQAANIFVDKDKKPLPYVKVGEKLYKSVCASCHTIDGNRGTGPTWKGLYKSNVAFDAAQSKVLSPGFTLSESDDDAKWDAYLVESILDPNAKIVQTFGPNMPSQESSYSDGIATQRKLSVIVSDIEHNRPTSYKEKKLAAITEYIKSVGDPKYYHPMTTPTAAPSVESPGSTAPTGAPVGEVAKPQAEVGAKMPSIESTRSSAENNPQANDHVAGKPTDEPVDKSNIDNLGTEKSQTPSPSPRKE